MSSSSLFDGVVNPNGLLGAAFAPVFLAVIPATNYLTAPNSFVQQAIETLIAAIPGSASIPGDRVIPALSAFYIFWTFAATGAISAAGLGASRKEGLDNNRTSSPGWDSEGYYQEYGNYLDLGLIPESRSKKGRQQPHRSAPAPPKRTLQHYGDVSWLRARSRSRTGPSSLEPECNKPPRFLRPAKYIRILSSLFL